MRELTQQCATLAAACGSSGMVLAMHHIQVACVARHAADAPYFRHYLKEVAERQPLVASVTSEVGVAGDIRSSVCAVERAGGRFTLDKRATTVSYGAQADDLLVTARRDPEAPPSDQVLVLLRRGDFALRPTSPWDTLGMRGTCSPGYHLTAAGPEEQIVPGAFADSSAETMVPYSHLLWSAVWLGLASDAVARAAAFVRAEARKRPGTPPPAALRLAELNVMLQTFRTSVAALAGEFDALGDGPTAREALSSIGWALRMNQHKIAASEMAPQIIHRALQIVGLSGYRNDTPYSVGRHYRDALSASLMISNERIAARSAALLMVFKDG
jgi:acyl-CoA dehydrogenase